MAESCDTLFERIPSGIMPLNKFGSEWSEKRIIKAINSKEGRMVDLISVLVDFGGVDKIAFYSIVVSCFFEKETQNWWTCILEKACDRNSLDLIIMIREEYIKRNKGELLLPDEKIWIDTVMNYEMLVWDILSSNEQFELLKESVDKRCIGLYFPSVYSFDADNLKELCELVFPILRVHFQSIISKNTFNADASAFIKMSLEHYLSEINIYCHQKIELKLYNVKRITKFRHDIEFSSSVYRFTSDEFKLSAEFCNHLIELIVLSNFTDVKTGSYLKQLSELLPFLYLMIGNRDEAYNLLINILLRFDYHGVYRNTLLLCIYWLSIKTESQLKRSRLLNVFNEAIYSTAGIIQFRNAAGYICNFYEQFSKAWNIAAKHTELRKELSGDQLFRRSIILIQGEEFAQIIQSWMIGDSKNDKGQVIEIFQKLYNLIQRADIYVGFDDVLIKINAFLRLFKGMTSHIDSHPNDARIAVKYVWDCIFPDKPCPYKKSELFYIYTEEDVKRLRVLNAQINEAFDNIIPFPYLHDCNYIINCIQKYWHEDDESVLSSTVLSGLIELQRNMKNWDYNENELNNLLAYYLRAHWGPENVHREEQQGISATGKQSGELDFIIYSGSKQTAILEALITTRNGAQKKNIENHLNKLIKKYNTPGVPFNALIIYERSKKGTAFFEYIKEYLKTSNSILSFSGGNEPVIEDMRKEDCRIAEAARVSHLRIKGVSPNCSMHVFTVLMYNQE